MENLTILAVFDPVRKEQPALNRAIAVAESMEASVHLFACIYTQVSDKLDITACIAKQKEELESISQIFTEKGIKITTEVDWDKDWYQGVVRAAIRENVDVVFKSTYKHSVSQRFLNRTSDWELIRKCPCPVLLVKESSKQGIKKILAAVDLRRGKDDYEKLNEKIINATKMYRNDSDVHFISAFQESINYPDRNELIKRCGVESKNIHIKRGSPEDVIVENAKSLEANMVVVGSSGRTGLAAAIHGNTAEKILDHLDCDILSMP
jgi:universal stress protein E